MRNHSFRNPKIHKIDKFFRGATALKVDVRAAERFVACGSNLGVIDAIAHSESFH
jgi:hypothetical protein